MLPNRRQESDTGLASSPMMWMAASAAPAHSITERGLPARWSIQPTKPSSRIAVNCTYSTTVIASASVTFRFDVATP